jgi:hypothetical protein
MRDYPYLPADLDGWGVIIGRALAAYSQHLTGHLPRTREPS